MFRNLFAKKDDLPYWAKGVKQQQYNDMWVAVRAFFEAHSTEIIENEQEGYIEPTSGYLAQHTLGLHNLVRHVKGMNAEQIAKCVNEHFGRFIDLATEQERVAHSSFDEVKHLFRVQLYFYDETQPDNFVADTAGKMLCSNLKACLTLELSHCAVTVSEVELQKWGVSIEELLELGLNHIFQGISDLPRFDPLNGKPIFVSNPDDLFISSICLDVERFASPEPEFGYLLFIPGRHQFLLFPMIDSFWMNQYDKLCAGSLKMFNESTGKVSSEAFWLKNGVFKPLGPSESKDGIAHLAELQKLLSAKN
jgi:hypothetical protein